MRSVALLSLGLLAACASTPDPSPSTPSQTVRVSPGTGGATTTSAITSLRINPTITARVDTLWMQRDRVWEVLPAVYAALEIPITQADPADGVLGNSNLKLYRRLGKIPLMRYLDCGTTQIGPNADSYEVMLSVLTKVQRARPDTTTTTVGTTVEAMARPVQYKGEYVRCTSKGALEARLVEVLKVHLAPPP